MRLMHKHHDKINTDSDVFSMTPTVGNAAKLSYYGTYRDLNRENDRSKHFGVKTTPLHAYLQQTERKSLLPIPSGILRRKGAETTIDIHQHSIGDLYAGALSKSLRKMPQLEILNLKGNGITERGAVKILKSIQVRNIKKINLSDNQLGERSIALIIRLITTYGNKITEIGLENTGLKNVYVAEIAEALTESRNIRTLNMSRNKLSDLTALGDLLTQTNTLEKLDLHWNNFKNCVAFFDALT
jgi:Leucine-rich repeat (LRR) protein